MAKTPSRPKRPADLKFSETHEWVRVDGADAVVGISDYAVGQLSDLVSIELPKAGTVVEVESPMGEIESVKTVAELVSPVGGKVASVNKDVVDNVDLLAESPYDDGWLVRIKMKDPKDLDHLMSTKDYEEYLKTLHEEEADDKPVKDEGDAVEEEDDDEEEDEADEDDEPES
jgi:glycine cleavage system H protein